MDELGQIPAPTEVKAPSYAPALASATTYTATPYKVEPQGLVQERIKGIVAQDSPLMQQAARIANQKSNERGLLNSNMAIGSAHEAVIGAAAPIANADANAINTAMMKTADQQNAASQFGAQANTNVALANADAANKAKAQTLEGTVQLTNSRMSQDAQMAMARLDSVTRERLAVMDSQTRSLLQTNQSASNAYVQAITNISNIQNNDKLNGTAKQAAIDSQINLLREQLGVLQATNQTTQSQIQYPEKVVSLNLGNFFDVDWNSTTPANTTPGVKTPTPGTKTTTQTPATGSGRLQSLLGGSPQPVSRLQRTDPTGRVI